MERQKSETFILYRWLAGWFDIWLYAKWNIVVVPQQIILSRHNLHNEIYSTQNWHRTLKLLVLCWCRNRVKREHGLTDLRPVIVHYGTIDVESDYEKLRCQFDVHCAYILLKLLVLLLSGIFVCSKLWTTGGGGWDTYRYNYLH